MPVDVAQNFRGQGTLHTLDLGHDFLVAGNVLTASTDDITLKAHHSDHLLTILGVIQGPSTVLQLGNEASVDKNITVSIGEYGRVTSAATGDVAAIDLTAASSNIINKGMIVGAVAIRLGGIGEGQTTIKNFGSILGLYGYAIEVAATATEDILLINSGSIGTGLGLATYFGSSGGDTIINTGNIGGVILLNDGDDIFDNFRGKTLQTQGVFGGDGDDLFIPGASFDSLHGDGGLDTVSFIRTTGVRVALDGSLEGTLTARGDEYHDIENVIGSLKGNDWLRGSLDSNSLLGNGGNDRLEGLAGDDKLNGGAGADTLVGGAGDDAFLFENARGPADRILDFGSGTGDDDQIWIDASAFGGNLLDGKPFRDKFLISTKNIAQEKADRFIYRITDDTLWFDVDGKGGKKAVLIAKLDPDATLHSYDFVLY